MSSPNQKSKQDDLAKNGTQQPCVGFELGRSIAAAIVIIVICAAAYVFSKMI